MDVDRGIRVAVDTGDVTLGSEKSIQSLKLGKGQLVVVASNAPKSRTASRVRSPAACSPSPATTTAWDRIKTLNIER